MGLISISFSERIFPLFYGLGNFFDIFFVFCLFVFWLDGPWLGMVEDNFSRAFFKRASNSG